MQLTYFPTAASLALTLVAFAASPARSQEETIGVWRVSCDEGPCQAFFTIQRDGSEIVSWSIVGDRTKGDASMLIRVPVNTALVPGLAVLASEDETFTMPFQFCNDTGCTAIARITDEMRAALGDKTMVRIAFYPYGQPEPLAYEVPVEGFDDVVGRLTSKD